MSNESCLRHFFAGVVLLLIVQTIFMLGGYAVEQALNIPVTGIPTCIGLTLVLILGMLSLRRASEYVLLGSFTLAFFSPLILFLTMFFKVAPAHAPLTHVSLIYLTLLIGSVWIYFLNKIAAANCDLEGEALPAMISNYYTSTGRKLGDFFIGLAGIPALVIFLMVIVANYTSDNAQLGVIAFLHIAALLAIIYFFLIGRKHIAIGMLCSVAIPVLIVMLLFGACALGLLGKF